MGDLLCGTSRVPFSGVTIKRERGRGGERESESERGEVEGGLNERTVGKHAKRHIS